MSGKTGDDVVDHVLEGPSWRHWSQRVRRGLGRMAATSAGLTALLGSGFLGLQLTDSRSPWAADSAASSLAQMSGALILVQSFRGDPGRNVPLLWTERLGVKPATDLWRRFGRSIWWQAWSQDGDPFLILQGSTLPDEIKALQRQQVGSLEVFASDPLHRQQLLQRLNSHQVSHPLVAPESLFGSCFQALGEGPGVFWSADALATLSGTLAPLLQQGREGCVQLQLQSDQLLWKGVIGRRPLSSVTQRRSVLSSGFVDADSDAMSSDQSLLRIDGQRLDLILGTLLSRQIIQAPLEEHYGISAAMRSKIADLPFAMRLQSRAGGVYKAGLQLQLPLRGQRQQWISILDAVSDRLRTRGFEQRPPGADASAPETRILFYRSDDAKKNILGGWEIIQGQKMAVLSIGLGAEPASQSFLGPQLARPAPALRITVAPERLKELGLLGGRWPQPVQRATILKMSINPLIGSGARPSWWRFSGSLTLKPAS